MNLAHLFEAGMLVCFGFSWPINVVKAYKAKTAKSTSLAFICLIITGYVAGIVAKLINRQFNYVLAVYFLNLAIVFANVVVYFRNKALDRKKEELSNLLQEGLYRRKKIFLFQMQKITISFRKGCVKFPKRNTMLS